MPLETDITSETNEVIRKHFAFKKIHTETSKNQVGKKKTFVFWSFLFYTLNFFRLKVKTVVETISVKCHYIEF